MHSALYDPENERHTYAHTHAHTQKHTLSFPLSALNLLPTHALWHAAGPRCHTNTHPRKHRRLPKLPSTHSRRPAHPQQRTPAIQPPRQSSARTAASGRTSQASLTRRPSAGPAAPQSILDVAAVRQSRWYFGVKHPRENWVSACRQALAMAAAYELPARRGAVQPERPLWVVLPVFAAFAAAAAIAAATAADLVINAAVQAQAELGGIEACRLGSGQRWVEVSGCPENMYCTCFAAGRPSPAGADETDEASRACRALEINGCAGQGGTAAMRELHAAIRRPLSQLRQLRPASIFARRLIAHGANARPEPAEAVLRFRKYVCVQGECELHILERSRSGAPEPGPEGRGCWAGKGRGGQRGRGKSTARVLTW